MLFLWHNLLFLILLGVLLVISAAFSGSEAVLFSLSRHDRLRMKKSRNRLDKLAAELLDDPRSLITTLMLGNMAANVSIFVLSTLLLERLGHDEGRGLMAVLILLPSLFVTYISDVLPKVVGSLTNTRIAPIIALPIATLIRLVWPISRTLDLAVLRPAHRLVSGGRTEPEASTRPALTARGAGGSGSGGNGGGAHAGGGERGGHFSPEELAEMLEMSQDQGVIDVSENELLQEVVRIGELRVRDVMTPRVDVVAFNLKDPADVLMQKFRQSHLAKMPAYEGQIDNITGLIYAKELFLESTGPDRKLDPRKLVRPIQYVPEFQTLDRLITRFRATRTQLAAVVDEFGGFVGLVTLEDVVEQMVGDIYEPHDAPRQTVEKVAPDQYRVAGDLSIVDWEEAFGIERPPLAARGGAGGAGGASGGGGAGSGGGGSRTGTSTVAGLIASILKRIPRPGDAVRVGHMRMTVESMRGRRVEKVLLTLGEDKLESTEMTAGGGEKS